MSTKPMTSATTTSTIESRYESMLEIIKKLKSKWALLEQGNDYEKLIKIDVHYRWMMVIYGFHGDSTDISKFDGWFKKINDLHNKYFPIKKISFNDDVVTSVFQFEVNENRGWTIPSDGKMLTLERAKELYLERIIKVWDTNNGDRKSFKGYDRERKIIVKQCERETELKFKPSRKRKCKENLNVKRIKK